jgi:hypothetical protein
MELTPVSYLQPGGQMLALQAGQNKAAIAALNHHYVTLITMRDLNP